MKDYKKKYEQALENLKRIKTANKDNKELVDFIEYKYPELKESEDEKIRKGIINFLSTPFVKKGMSEGALSIWIAWLEKQGEPRVDMVQWKGDNLKEVLEFTGKNKNFDKWFTSFEKFEEYVHEHNDIFKIFNEDGSHYEVPVGAWIVKTLDGYNVPSKAKYKQKIEQKSAWSEENEWIRKEKEINLVEILKHYPRETELYSPLHGKLWLAEVNEEHGIITCYKYPLGEGDVRATLKQEDTVAFYSNGTTGLPDFNVSKDCMLFLHNNEKQGEQKPTNKIKPKFKVGDYIVGKHVSGYISKISDGWYLLDYQEFPIYEQDNYHLWTIQDAKAGDVLYYKSHSGTEYIVMSSGVNQFGNIDSYFRYNSVNGFGISVPSVLSTKYDYITPATKEQRDLLFKKMKEAGYEWDVNKKELKKIEQKPEIKDDVLSRFAFYQYDDDTIYLSSLFVRDSDRGHGYGSKVLKAAEEVAKTFGISKIRLKVERNTLTEKWYEKNGYKYLSSEGKYDWLENRVIDIKPDKIEQNSNGDNCKIFDCDKVDMTEYNKGYECGKQRVLKYPEDFGLCKQSTWSEEDEAYYNFLNKILTVNHPNAMFSANGNSYFDSDVSEKQIEQWLKSLKERMKGE